MFFFVISCPTPTRERADQNVDRLPHSGCACARCCARTHGHSQSRSTRQSVPIVQFSGTISSAMSSYVNLQPLVAFSNEERDGIWKIEREFSCSPVAQCARKRDLRAQGFRLARKVSWHDIRAAAPRRAHNSACLLSSSLGRRWNCRRHNLH